MGIIGYRLHRALDIATVLAFLAAPTLLGLPQRGAIASYALAGAHTLVTVATTPPGGRGRVLPYVFHGWIELGVSLVLPALGLASGLFPDATSRYFLAGSGGVIFLVWLLSDYRTAAEGASASAVRS
jgi:hypothetical protein